MVEFQKRQVLGDQKIPLKQEVTTGEIHVKKIVDAIDVTDRALRDLGKVDIAAFDAALPAGINNIGDVDVASLPSLPAGINNIGKVDVASQPATVIAGMTSLPAGTNIIGKVDNTNTYTNYGTLQFIRGNGVILAGTTTTIANISGKGIIEWMQVGSRFTNSPAVILYLEGTNLGTMYCGSTAISAITPVELNTYPWHEIWEVKLYDTANSYFIMGLKSKNQYNTSFRLDINNPLATNEYFSWGILYRSLT
uniref:Uncharacterized protein n=1 Tax=viral metagenome TaxID=1070528 RepID=A0A6H2A0Z0_9ZZZZ